MGKLKKRLYQLKICSKLILSPRIYYEEKNGEKFETIYPFYQYGTYKKYDPKNTQYYIPGSSIKGALCANMQEPRVRLMIDDIYLKSDDLVLKNLFKVQHMMSETDKQMTIEKFFPNIKIEMLNCNKERKYEGTLFCEEDPTSHFKVAEERTVNLLEQLYKRIEKCSKQNKTADCSKILDDLSNNIKKILEEVNCKDKKIYTLILGGYKGLILSGEFQNAKYDYQSAIYIDKEHNLPHGLVQITL